VGMSTK